MLPFRNVGEKLEETRRLCWNLCCVAGAVVCPLGRFVSARGVSPGDQCRDVDQEKDL